jgi:hypothetical protein
MREFRWPLRPGCANLRDGDSTILFLPTVRHLGKNRAIPHTVLYRNILGRAQALARLGNVADFSSLMLSVAYLLKKNRVLAFAMR